MADPTHTATGASPLGPPAGQPTVALADTLRACGTRHLVGANRPVAVVGDVAWYVAEGDVDLFLQEQEPDGVGRRRLLCSARTGTLVWTGGGAFVPDGWRLLAVGHAGTQLLSVPGPELRRQVDPAIVADHVEAFVAGVAAATRAPGPVQQPPGRPPSDTPDASGSGADASGARITAARQAFGEIVRARIAGAIDEDSIDAARIGSVVERQNRLLDSALADLIEVVDRAEPLAHVPADQLAQLDVALSRIGRQIGVVFPDDQGLEDADPDPVARRVKAAGCRVRTVTLDAQWWTRPGLALLGFLGPDDRPVALVTVRGRYVLFDPATAESTRVDQSVAERLAPRAFTFYRPLPRVVTSATTLLRAALPGLRSEVWLLVVLGALAGLVTLITPLVTSMVYNSVLPLGNRSLLLAVSCLLFGTAVTWGFVSLAQNLTMVRISGRLEAHLDPAVMDRLLALPADFFRRYDTGDLATRAAGLQIIRLQLSGTVVTSFLGLIFSVFNVVLLFGYSVVLGLVSMAVLVVAGALLVPLNLRVVRHQQRAFDATGDVAGDLFQVVSAVHKVRIAAAEARLMARWASLFRVQQRATYAAGRSQAWIFAVIATLPAALALGLYGVAGTALVGDISPGDFLGLVTALGQFTAALIGVALSIGPLLTVVALWRRLLPIFEEPLEEVGTVAPGPLSGSIALRDVSFSYDEESAPVLTNVSFDVQPGELVAITGSSGSGKSTLMRLLLGLERPRSGTVLYDGKDLQSLDARDVRRQIGVVMQGARPLPGEIMTTILGDQPGDERDAWAAAEAAELASDIRRMPMKMHTIIGEGGLAFSGGQVQRMMIARALARRPRVIFLDEATSALDDRVQAAVSERINALQTTRVVIAHRLSTIRDADLILVLEGGVLVESGTYAELIELDGAFSKLAARQTI